MKRADVLLIAPMQASVMAALDAAFTLHRLWLERDKDRFLADIGPRIRGMAISTLAGRLDGLDVYADEPHVPLRLIDLPQVVPLPHIGSGSVHTREAMGALVVANLEHWFDTGPPLTPVTESRDLVTG